MRDCKHFRGTDKNDLGNWISNFQWLNRLAPKFDQYMQVQAHIAYIVKRIKQNGCNGDGTQFVRPFARRRAGVASGLRGC